MSDSIDKLITAALFAVKDDSLGDPCPDETIFCDYLYGQLKNPEIDVFECHLADCVRCRHALIVLQDMRDNQEDQNGYENSRRDFESELSRLELELGLMAPDSPQSDATSIMVVDDDFGYLSSLTDALSKDYSVISCSNGQQAIARMQRGVKAVVLDIKMPGMSGLEVARILKKDYADCSLIFNTGHPGEYLQEQIEHDFRPFGYVQKDNPHLLMECIYRAIKSGRSFAQASC